MSEQRAIIQLRQGDIGGLEFIVRQYQTQALRVAYLITCDQSLAEDVVQSAFVRVYERINQFDIRRPFAPWFMRIIANDAIKACQKRMRSVSLETDGPDERGHVEWLHDDMPLPDTLIEEAQTREELWALLRELPAEQRAVIVLRYYAGLKSVEISGRLYVPQGTVRWRLHAALKYLRRALGGTTGKSTLDHRETSDKQEITQ